MKRSLINQPFLTETGEFELEERERGEGGGGRGTKDGGWRRNDFKGTWGIGEGVQSRQTSLKLYNVPRVDPTWRAPTTLCITRKSARRCGGGSFDGNNVSR